MQSSDVVEILDGHFSWRAPDTQGSGGDTQRELRQDQCVSQGTMSLSAVNLTVKQVRLKLVSWSRWSQK